MITLIKKIHSKIPLIVKRLAITCGVLSSAIGGYGLVANDDFFIKTGGVCLMISVGLPPLLGIKKDEQTNDNCPSGCTCDRCNDRVKGK
jgi:hypothetical protein